MKTSIKHSSLSEKAAIHHASQCIHAGSVLAYPTESVWGLGCDPFNEEAFDQLLTLKNRPQEKGVILIAGHINQVQPYINHLPPEMQQRLAESWETQYILQQGVTWLIPLTQQTQIPPWITGSHKSVALRVTPHPRIQALCRSIDSCLVSTSCNRAGNTPATTEAQAREYFEDTVSYLSGRTLGFEKPSRILDATSGAIMR